MIIVQISDLHVSAPESPLDREYRTTDRLHQAIAHINGLPQQPDAVIVTGDLVDQGTVEEYRRLRTAFETLRPRLFLLIGNHDNRNSLRTVFHDHSYLPSDGFLHYTVDVSPVRVIALDTHVPGKSHGELCDERLDWLDSRLREETNRPTVIAMHHPPFITGLAKMDEMGLFNAERLGEIVSKYENVERILCGHMHRSIVKRLFGTIASVCPSTSHQIQLDLGGHKRLAVVREPPACQVHAWIEPGALVSHTSFIGDYGDPHLMFDGQHWVARKSAEPVA